MATHKPVVINELFGELIVPEGDYRWVVVHAKPRCEKKLADFALREGIHYYLPQLKREKVYQRRKVATTLPMFPGYIFLILNPQNKQHVASSGLTVSFIKVTQQQELVDELSRICFGKTKEAAFEPCFWLSKGLEVTITDGPLKGTTGIVESHDKLHEVRLQVNILRQAVMVKVDPKYVKILGEYEVVEEK